jgi:hypothetical protein
MKEHEKKVVDVIRRWKEAQQVIEEIERKRKEAEEEMKKAKAMVRSDLKTLRLTQHINNIRYFYFLGGPQNENKTEAQSAQQLV